MGKPKKKPNLSIYLKKHNLQIYQKIMTTRTQSIFSIIVTLVLLSQLGFTNTHHVGASKYERKRLELAIIKDMKREINLLSQIELKNIQKGANLRELKFKFYE